MRRSALRIARPLARSLAGSSPVAAGPLSSLDLDHLQDKYSSRDYDMFANKNFSDLVAFTRASAKWVPDATGTLVQVDSGVAATAYDALTLEKLGLSVEEQRTNSVRNNSMAGVALGSPGTPPTRWFDENRGGLTRTIVASGTEYGLPYIDVRVSGTTSTIYYNIHFGATTDTPAAAGQTWSFSMFAKLIAGSLANINTLGIVVGERDSGSAYLTSGSVAVTPTGAFTRFSNTRTLASASAAFVEPWFTLNFASGVPIDITLRIYAPQLELGAFATSPILTTSAQATRAADSAVINNIAPWFNPSEGTVYIEAILGNDSPTGFPTLLELSDGTASNRLLLRRSNVGNSIAAIATAAGTGYTAADAVPFPSGQIIRAALAYDAGTVAVCANGRAVVSTASAPISGINKLGIGFRASAGTEYIGGAVRAVRYFPKRLANADLIAMTTKADPGFTINFDFDAKTYYMGLA